MISQKNLWSGYLLGTAGLLMVYLLPQLVGLVTEQLNLNPKQTGLFASSDLIGYSITSISSYFWIRKSNWRLLSFLAISIMILGNGLSLLTDSFGILIFLRILTGFGQGIAVALALALVNDSTNTDRTFAIYLMVTLIAGAILVELVPLWSVTGKADPIYYAQMALSVIVIPFLFRWMPVAGNLFLDNNIESTKLSPSVLISLGAVLFMFMAYGGVWSLTERIGQFAGYDDLFIASTLSTALIAAIPALFVPILIGSKYGRILPLTISFILMIIYPLLIMTDSGSKIFLIAVVAGSFGVNMVLPFIAGQISEMDESGKGVIMVTPMYSIGFALGPAILSLFVTNKGYWVSCLIASAITTMVYFIFLKLKSK